MARSGTSKRSDGGPAHGGLSSGRTPIEDPAVRGEENPSLRDAARSLYTRRHEPDVEVDMRIAASMGGVLGLGGGVLAALMLVFAAPTRAVSAGRSGRR
jgi:hypothetical protein